MDIDGKIVIITGASEGIGAATAKAFAAQGAKVVIVARSEMPLRKLAQEIGESKTLVVPADMSRPAEIKEMTRRAAEHFGEINILINNAAVNISSKIVELDRADFNQAWAVNILGPLCAIQEVVPVMRRNGGGLIINVSSMITSLATIGSGGYRATKMALNALSDAARLELKKENIKIITAYPGLTATQFFNNSLGIRKKYIPQNRTTPRGRSPQFVAKRLVYAARKEPRVIYMGLKGCVGSKIAALFPSLIENLLLMKNSK